MNAKSFCKEFTVEWKATESSADFHNGLPFEDKPAWTSYMLTPDGFLNRVMRRLERPSCPLFYKNEWYTVDALYIGGCDLFRNNLLYPSSVKVLIEHEWGESLEEEMWKLIHWRAPLKVIIAYDWSEKEKTTEARHSWANKKLEKLRDMLQIVNDSFSENAATEYLFLIAQHKEPGSPIHWRAVILTSSDLYENHLTTTLAEMLPQVEDTEEGAIEGA